VDILNISSVVKRFPAHGTISSEDFNELVEQLVLDLTTIATNLNTSVQPLVESLPAGSRVINEIERSGSPNPIANGLDGSQLYLNMTAVDTNDPLLFNRLLGRPNTILEALQYLLTRIEQLAQSK